MRKESGIYILASVDDLVDFDLISADIPSAKCILAYSDVKYINLSDTPRNKESVIGINSSSCLVISTYAFENCFSLKVIILPKCVMIQDAAFANCSSLVTVDFPNCKTVKGSAFANCQFLISASLPKCTLIENKAFENCCQLQTLTLRDPEDAKKVLVELKSKQLLEKNIMNIDEAFKKLIANERWYVKTHTDRKLAGYHKKRFKENKLEHSLKTEYLLNAGYTIIQEESWEESTLLDELKK